MIDCGSVENSCFVGIKCFFRSTITIFCQRTKPGHDFRVWNELLIRYAGYEREKDDGTREIIGDPASLDFTKVLILNCYMHMQVILLLFVGLHASRVASAR